MIPLLLLPRLYRTLGCDYSSYILNGFSLVPPNKDIDKIGKLPMIGLDSSVVERQCVSPEVAGSIPAVVNSSLFNLKTFCFLSKSCVQIVPSGSPASVTLL